MASITALDSLGTIYTAIVVLVVGLVVYVSASKHQPYPGIPIASLESRPWYKFWILRKAEYTIHGSRLIEKGKQLTSGCFQVQAGAGYKIILPNRFAREIGNLNQLSFTEIGRRDFHIDLPGFEGVKEGFRADGLMFDVVRIKLTQNLALVTEIVVDETPLALQKLLGGIDEWQTVVIKDTILDVVAWVSTRVFAGKELARDENWRRVSKEYTMLLFRNAHALRRFPAFIRPVMNWLLPSCSLMRERLQQSRKLVGRQLENRLEKRGKQSWDAEGNLNKDIDCFHWMIDLAKGRPLDFPGAQLQLGVVAINTTSEVLVRCILQMCDTPDIVPALREEMIQVLCKHGWANSSLSQMKLLDSFIKENQRFYSMWNTTMARVATENISLSDGTTIPAGAFVMTMNDRLRDPDKYQDPDKFDAYRFLKLRSRPGEETNHQYATVTPDNLGFGYGDHACAGRFFASNVVKVVLCFLVLMYDFEYEDGGARFPLIESENAIFVHPGNRVRIRGRKVEIDLIDPTSRC
ncbi:cytochrome P450-like protein [Dothistroma septosporum NZE10]|uniref:Cytochrome P450-like protein n=1 Tax=Dothistroma septosporum (strain NZE10 / CBS 128990) TaxID=675120 RepID=M2Y2E9_DOTSN|nr:cytochrome P450-like protein [Dothistroma septosporum NZE10]